MKLPGSRIASNIDREYQRNLDYYRRHYCEKCNNKESSLCEIRYTINRQLKCVYYDKKEDK